jgi:uncharacterized membrane protein YdjX (TVP38/TMEM64 family)
VPIRRSFRLLIPVAVILLASATAWKLGYFDIDRRGELASLVRAASGSPWALPLFLTAYVLVVLLCLPATILTVVGGALFGALRGGIGAWLGAMIGTALAYTLARSIGRNTIQRMFGKHKLLDRLRQHAGVRGLIMLRVVPIGPFGVLSYVAGVARVPLRKWLLATGIGTLPTVAAYAFAGEQLRKGFESGGRAGTRAFFIAGALSLGLMATAFIFGWINRRKGAA